jgi:hypothetical protein
LDEEVSTQFVIYDKYGACSNRQAEARFLREGGLLAGYLSGDSLAGC